MNLKKQINQALTLFLASILITLSFACSSDDDAVDNIITDDDKSSYDISIEGEGEFTRNNISVNDAQQVTVGGFWFESPDTDGELIITSINESQGDGIVLSSSIVLLNGNPAPLDSPANFNDENPQTSLLNIQVNDENYISSSGSIEVSNLELIPQEMDDTPGETALANFNMSFTGEFYRAGSPEEESVQISGDVKIHNPSF